MKTLILILAIFMCATIACEPPPSSKKGNIRNEDLRVIINDIPYNLYSLHDGWHEIQLLVPECNNCKIPFSSSMEFREGKQTRNITTVIIPKQDANQP